MNYWSRIWSTGGLGLLLAFGATCFLGIVTSISQVYTDQIGELAAELQYPFSEYGGGVSFVDWNGDGLDDITIARLGETPVIFQNTGSGFIITQPILDVIDGETKAVIWVDYDNDGDKDLFTTEYLNSPKLYNNNDGNFTNVTTFAGFVGTQFETFGASWADYDRDGFLDVYISNYNLENGIENQLYRNNGDGTFNDLTAVSNVGNGSQATFISLWWDYNRNGWPDLFVANDRDPFFNYLYQNQAGNFGDVSLDLGLYDNIWSMSTSPADFDNDGDLDLYISNAWDGHRLYRQNELGTFDNVAWEVGITDINFAWAAQWVDYNLDGLQDLYICYEPNSVLNGTNQMLTNFGEVFIYDNSMGLDSTETESHSSAVGDWNDDGIFDIFCYNEQPFASQLWTSTNEGGTYLKVGLRGTISNRDAIGSFITIWVDGQQQMRHTYCGEGYLSQNSTKEIFGLNGHTTVDSLQVIWPSGIEEMMYNIEANQCITLVEGLSGGVNIQDAEDMLICGEDEVIIYLPDFASYEWSNGSFNNAVILSETTDVWVVAQNQNGQTLYSDTISVVFYDEPTITAEVIQPTCFGAEDGSISLVNATNSGVETIVWTNEDETMMISDLATGYYGYTLVDELGCVAQDSIFLEQPAPLSIEVSTESVSCFGGNDGGFTYQVNSSQGQVMGLWEFDPDSLQVGEYLLEFSDGIGCLYDTLISVTQPNLLTGEIEVVQTDTGFDCSYTYSGGTEPITPLWSNGETDPHNLNLGNGDQWVTLTDSLGCETTIEFALIFNLVTEMQASDVRIFANPSDGKSITVQSDSRFDEIRIHTLSGTLVQSEMLEKASRQFRVVFTPNLTAGVYLLEVRFQNQTRWTGQLVVE